MSGFLAETSSPSSCESAPEGIQVLRARRVAQGLLRAVALGRDDLLERALFFSSREVPALPGRAEVVAVLDGVDALATDVAAAGEAHDVSRSLFFFSRYYFSTRAPRRRPLLNLSLLNLDRKDGFATTRAVSVDRSAARDRKYIFLLR